MVSGTDEHGTPITYGADQDGVAPRVFADRYNTVITDDLQRLGISYDLFTRTTTRNHYHVTQELFRTLYAKGYIAARTQLGAFSPSTGRTLPDRYIEGTCPICGFGEARGDQCDNCGNQLDPTDLINPRSRVNGEPPEFRETEHFFIELPRFAGRLQEWITAQTHWRTNVRQFSLALARDLKPRAITRDLDWGVPVPLPGWRTTRTRRSTSGSTPSSGTSRRPSSGPAEPGTRTPGRPGGSTPRSPATTSWGRTTSPSTPSSGRPSCSGRASSTCRTTSPPPSS